jgi:hypothetical protein
MLLIIFGPHTKKIIGRKAKKYISMRKAHRCPENSQRFVEKVQNIKIEI